MLTTNADIQILRLNKKLRKIGNSGIPQAAADTLNTMGFRSKIQAEREFKKDHIIRSNFVQKGMLFEQTKSNMPIAQMEVKSGNIRDFADTLESGGVVRPTRRYLEVPTNKSRTSGSKTKKVARKNRLDRMNSRRLPRVSGGVRRRFTAMLTQARREGYYGPFFVSKEEAGGDKTIPTGVFNLTGHGRKKHGGGRITKLRHLQKKVTIKGHPFVKPAGKIVGRDMDKIYVKSAQKIIGKMGGRV